MKTLIVSNLYGEFELVNKLFDTHPEVDMCISLGDNYLFSSSTPLEYFVRGKYREKAKEVVEKNKKGFTFNKPLFSLYGELDDPFAHPSELKLNNFFPLWQSVITFAAFNEDKTKNKSVRVGFLSGYYAEQTISKTNKRRNKMSREKRSMALCYNDFEQFRDVRLDYLFTHEAPSGYTLPGKEWGSFIDVGCRHISNIIENSKTIMHFFGHHKTLNFIENNAPVGTSYCAGELKMANTLSYFILDMYTNIVKSHISNLEKING